MLWPARPRHWRIFRRSRRLTLERGVDALQEDLIAMLGLCPPSAPELVARVQAVLRLLQREAHHLRGGDAKSQSTLFAQQIRNRAVQSGINSLQSSAEQRLLALSEPHFRLQWTASRESPDLVRTLTGHGDWVNAVALCADGRHALSGCEDRNLRFWDLQTGQLLHTFAGHEAGVKAVGMSRGGRHALSASGDRTLKLWDLATGQLVRTLVAHEDGVSAVAISQGTRQAVSGSRDRTLRLWDLETGQLLRTFAGHADAVTTVSVSIDGHHALSGSRDRTLRLWNLATGQLLHTLSGHEGMVQSVSFIPGRAQRPLGLGRPHVEVMGPGNRSAPSHFRRSRRCGQLGGGEPRWSACRSQARATARSGSGT